MRNRFRLGILVSISVLPFPINEHCWRREDYLDIKRIECTTLHWFQQTSIILRSMHATFSNTELLSSLWMICCTECRKQFSNDFSFSMPFSPIPTTQLLGKDTSAAVSFSNLGRLLSEVCSIGKQTIQHYDKTQKWHWKILCTVLPHVEPCDWMEAASKRHKMHSGKWHAAMIEYPNVSNVIETSPHILWWELSLSTADQVEDCYSDPCHSPRQQAEASNNQSRLASSLTESKRQ